MTATSLRQRDPRRGLFARIRAQSGYGASTNAPESGNELPDFDGEVLRVRQHNRPLNQPTAAGDDFHYLVDTDQIPAPLAPPAPVPPPHIPPGNRFYDSQRTQENCFRFLVDYIISGNYTAPAAGTAFSAFLTTAAGVIYPYPARLRLCEYPYTMQAFLVVRGFAASPRTTADTGNITWTYIGRAGHVVTINIGTAASPVNDDHIKLVPDPLTDATPADFGSLQIAASPGAVTAAVWDWSILFSVAYLKPGALQ
jgi:hypothetical protein